MLTACPKPVALFDALDATNKRLTDHFDELARSVPLSRPLTGCRRQQARSWNAAFLKAGRFLPDGDVPCPAAAPGTVTQSSNGMAIASPSEMETTMLRHCPTDAKATLALVALSAFCILGWLADLRL